MNAAASGGAASRPRPPPQPAPSQPAIAVVLDAAWLSPPKAGWLDWQLCPCQRRRHDHSGRRGRRAVTPLPLTPPAARRLRLSASPSTSISATPSSSASASPTSSASASPSSSASASPSPSPVPRRPGSASPSPSPTPAGSSPSVQLCLQVRAITAEPGVHPGGTARYAIRVWPAGGAAGGVTVTVSGKAGSERRHALRSRVPRPVGASARQAGSATGPRTSLRRRSLCLAVPPPGSRRS